MVVNEIKSQDDLNKPETHSIEVLLSTIDELERTKKQLEIAKDCLKTYADCDYYLFPTYRNGKELADKALKEIEELEK